MQSVTRFDGRSINNKEEWITPPYIIGALTPFDLDPCAAIGQPWPTAKKHYTINDDGLLMPWGEGQRIWLNPPYGKSTPRWIERLAIHGRGTALIFARTETKTFFPYVWDCASAILFLKGRISFYNVDGTLGDYSGVAPSCLIAYGAADAEVLAQTTLVGKFIRLK